VAFGVGWLAVALVASWGFWQVGRAVTHPSAPPPALPESVVGSTAVPVAAESGLDRVVPVKIAIKRIKLSAWVDQIGRTADGALEEQPFSTASHAAWYRGGPAPGEIGPSVITGHVDTKDSIAVFFYLSRLRPGDDVVITRADGHTVTFTVDWLGSFPKTQFPTDLVYGPTNYPALRLITCGGKFDRTKLSYVDNIVVFAHMSDHT
jgi:Sortase domain